MSYELDKARSMIKNEILSLVFPQFPDRFFFFLGDCDNSGKLTGISVKAYRSCKGIFPVHEDFVPRIFQPHLTQIEPMKWKLVLQPLTQPLTVMKKSDKFISLYPFTESKKNGVIDRIEVQYAKRPLRTWYEVHAMYKAGKDQPLQQLRKRVECSDTFTHALYDFCMGILSDRDDYFETQLSLKQHVE